MVKLGLAQLVVNIVEAMLKLFFLLPLSFCGSGLVLGDNLGNNLSGRLLSRFSLWRSCWWLCLGGALSPKDEEPQDVEPQFWARQVDERQT